MNTLQDLKPSASVRGVLPDSLVTVVRGRLVDSFMALDDVATYSRLSKDTIYYMAQTGKIRASKVGNQWRFRREKVDAWLQQHKNLQWSGLGTDRSLRSRGVGW